MRPKSRVLCSLRIWIPHGFGESDDDLEEEIRDLRESYAEIENQLAEFERRLEELESKADFPDRDESTEAVETEDASETGKDAERKPWQSANGGGDEDGEGSEYVTVDEGFEVNLGLKWMGRIGALAVTLGVAFFIVYAIQEELVSYAARIALGVLFGTALVGVGNYFVERPDYRLWGTITVGAGVAVAYFSVYASWGFEDYREAIGMTPTLNIALLTAVIAAAVALSLYRDTWVIGAEAFVLGYTTAYLVPEPGIVPLTYVFLLSLGAVAFAWYADWEWARLGVIGVLGSYGVFFWWADTTNAEPRLGYPFLFGFGVIFTVYAFVCERRQAEAEEEFVATINGLNAAAFYLLFYYVTVEHFEGFVDVATLGVGVVYLGVALVAYRWSMRGNALSSAAVAWALVLLSAWLGFKDGHVTVAWAAICVGLTALAYTKTTYSTYTAAYATAVVVGSKSLLLDHALPTEDVGVLALRSVAFLAAAFACYVGYVGLHEVSKELSDDFYDSAPVSWLGTGVFAILLLLQFDGFGVSVAWTVFALSLLVVGIAVRNRDIRLQGLAVFSLTILKVFFVDTAALDTLGRTVSFVVLGVILLAASFIYSRYRDEVQEWV